MCPRRSDRVSHGLALVAAEVVHHHHVAGRERRHQHLFDIGTKGRAVDRTVQHEGRVDPIMSKRGDERHGPPVAMRRAPDQPFALGSPAPQRRHVGLGPGFVHCSAGKRSAAEGDEHKAARVDPALMSPPAGATAAHVGAVLFFCELGLFLNE